MTADSESDPAAPSFQALFLHDRLLLQVMNDEQLGFATAELERANALVAQDAGRAYAFESALPGIFEAASELSVLYVQDVDIEGRLVTLTQDFYFKDVGEGRRRFHAGLDVERDVQVWGEFSIARTIGTTGDTTLTGHDRVCMLARVVSATETEIRLQPMFMGFRYFDHGIIGVPFDRSFEVFPEQVAQFMKVQDVEPSPADMRLVKGMPEEEVKSAFAEIIGEPYVAKDWGGELSDLFTNRLTVAGRRVNAAFAFKGPATKGRLTIKKMGANGDQAIRLSQEPAELMIVQHHDLIAQPVRRLLQALSRDAGKRYMTLDGLDTARILRAYGALPGP